MPPTRQADSSPKPRFILSSGHIAPACTPHPPRARLLSLHASRLQDQRHVPDSAFCPCRQHHGLRAAGAPHEQQARRVQGGARADDARAGGGADLAAACGRGGGRWRHDRPRGLGAFLAVILGLFIPVVFLITLYIQSEAQGTATTFRNPDSSGGERSTHNQTRNGVKPQRAIVCRTHSGYVTPENRSEVAPKNRQPSLSALGLDRACPTRLSGLVPPTTVSWAQVVATRIPTPPTPQCMGDVEDSSRLHQARVFSESRSDGHRRRHGSCSLDIRHHE